MFWPLLTLLFWFLWLGLPYALGFALAVRRLAFKTLLAGLVVPALSACLVAAVTPTFATVSPTYGVSVSTFLVFFALGAVIGSMVRQSYGPAVVGAVLLVVWWIVLAVTSTGLFRSDKVSHLVEIKKTDKVLHSLDPDRIRLVPRTTAYRLADKVLGSYTSKDGKVLGSMVEVDQDHMTIQKIEDKLYWVVPLRYRGLFKQLSLGPIPGFVLVDAYHVENGARLVTHNPKTGEPYRLECSLAGYLERNAERRINARVLTKKLTDYSFEVDDNWQPKVVATIMEPAVGFSYLKPVGVAIMDLSTCKVEVYYGDQIPTWVDRVVPETTAVEFLNGVGKWNGGVTSALFSKATVWQVTDDQMLFVEDGSGRTYWVSSVTSAGSDASAVAIVAVDTRTFEAFWEPISGPTETGVQEAVAAALGAERQVWVPQKPLLYRIYDQLVWVSPIVDKERGYPVAYGLVSADNVGHLSIDRDFSAAVRRFFQGRAVLELKEYQATYSGRLLRVATTGQYAYFLDGEKRIWACSLQRFRACALTRDGDLVEMKGRRTEDQLLEVLWFKNKTL